MKEFDFDRYDRALFEATASEIEVGALSGHFGYVESINELMRRTKNRRRKHKPANPDYGLALIHLSESFESVEIEEVISIFLPVKK